MKIIIGADLVPTESNRDLFIEGDLISLMGKELVDLIRGADYSIFNLEMPLLDSENPIIKCGPCLKASTDTVISYKKLGIDFLTLANNHIMDHGRRGLESTCRVLGHSGIAYGGVGKNLAEMNHSHVFAVDGVKIGIYCCAEHEFSIATENFPGANPFDSLRSFDHIRSLSEQCDRVIVLYHGGKEHYRYPSPLLQRKCRKMVESGADLVLCQHSHCIGCEEFFNAGRIVYGQGNFLFDDSDNEFWNTGLLVLIEDDFSISYLPVIKNGEKVRLATEEEKVEIISLFNGRSSEIVSENEVIRHYMAFAENTVSHYLLNISGLSTNILFRIINKLSGYRFQNWYVKNCIPAKRIASCINFIECEAHNELFIAGLKVLSGEKKQKEESNEHYLS